ncbi:MAG: T9SS type A sorting domain-containing protein, partial [Candidatus Cloacimonetes bacterium]|nr:T9SS type A sorting domain-containing protein [Candidatus Cloacimonadota bacterium]
LSDWSEQTIKLGFCCCSYDALLLLLDNVVVSGTTSIEENSVLIPKTHIDIFPNPMNNSGTFIVKNADKEAVTLSVYDIKGRRIRDIYTGVMDKGNHEFSWDGFNQKKEEVPSGVYLLRLHSKNYNSVQKFIYFK